MLQVSLCLTVEDKVTNVVTFCPASHETRY